MICVSVWARTAASRLTCIGQEVPRVEDAGGRQAEDAGGRRHQAEEVACSGKSRMSTWISSFDSDFVRDRGAAAARRQGRSSSSGRTGCAATIAAERRARRRPAGSTRRWAAGAAGQSTRRNVADYSAKAIAAIATRARAAWHRIRARKPATGGCCSADGSAGEASSRKRRAYRSCVSWRWTLFWGRQRQRATRERGVQIREWRLVPRRVERRADARLRRVPVEEWLQVRW